MLVALFVLSKQQLCIAHIQGLIHIICKIIILAILRFVLSMHVGSDHSYTSCSVQQITQNAIREWVLH